MNWPFDDPRNVAVFTSRFVVEEDHPIFYVTHDLEDGAWQFHAHNHLETTNEDIRLVALEEVMPTNDTLATMREDERAAFVRHAIEGEPGAERLLTSAGLIDALALELHDDTGAVLETRTLGVTELALEPAAFREVLAALEPGADPALSDTPPFFLLVAGF